LRCSLNDFPFGWILILIDVTRKILDLLTPAERKSALIMLSLMGLAWCWRLWALACSSRHYLMMQGDLATRYPGVQPVLEFMDNPTKPK